MEKETNQQHRWEERIEQKVRTGGGKEHCKDPSEQEVVPSPGEALPREVEKIGQKAEPVEGVAANEKGGVAAEEGKTNVAKVFAAGDIVNGGKTVVEAVAAGKEAAAAIAAYLEKGVK